MLRLKFVFFACLVVVGCIAPADSPLTVALKSENQHLRDKINSDNVEIGKLKADKIEIEKLRAELALAKFELSKSTNVGMFSGGAPYLLVICLAMMGAVYMLMKRGTQWRSVFEALSEVVETHDTDNKQSAPPAKVIKSRFKAKLMSKGLDKLVEKNLKKRGIIKQDGDKR